MNKICYVVTTPLTVKAFFVPQLKFLAQNGFDVSVACSNDASLQEILGSNVKFYPIDIPRGISLLKTISSINKLKYLFVHEHFDCVQYS